MYDAEPAHHYQVPEQLVRPAPEYSVSRETTPAWVEPATLPEKESKNAIVLEDVQYNPDLHAIYHHTVLRMRNIHDILDAANLNLSFNPYYQKLILHSCDIIRGEERIDRLHEAQIYVIQQEPGLDGLMFCGELQAVLFVDDVREGDLLEYSLTTEGAPFDHRGWRTSLQTSMAIDKLHLRMIKSNEREARIRHFDPESIASFSESETDYVATVEPCPARKRESLQPKGYHDAPYVEFTEYTSWNQVVHDELDFYQIDPAFALNEEASRLVAAWKRDSSNPEEAALKALRFVQDEIRYLAVCLGMGGWKPAPAEETLKKRYGDCKAKTQLLRSFLDLIDIPSAPFLVNTQKQDGIDNYLPQGIFDHVITRIDLSDGPAYVDPTGFYEGGSLRESRLPYRKGLALTEESNELTSIPIQRPEIDIDRTTSFTLKDGEVELTVTSLYYGDFANHVRTFLETRGEKKHLKSVRKNHETLFGPVEILSSKYEDDRLANCISATWTFHLEDPWWQNKQEENFFFYAYPKLALYFDQEFDPERETPLRLPNPERIRESISVSGLSLKGVSTTIEHPAFEFRLQCDSEDSAEFELNSKLDRLEVEELDEYAEKLVEGYSSCRIFIYERTQAERDALRIAKLLATP